MMVQKNKIYFFILFYFITFNIYSFSLWRNPEAADRNSVFIDVSFSKISFSSDGFHIGLPLEIRADYVLPVPLPISLGMYFESPDPNLKHFGLRASYHIDVLGNEKTDFYFSYVFDFGFVRKKKLLEYNDTVPEVIWYDFRFGVRQLFGNYFCLTLETGYKIWALLIMASIKLN